MRIALSSTPHAALLHLAAANGYFADEGLEVEVTLVSHGAAALELLQQGKVELAAAAEVPFVIAVLQGQPIDILATVASDSSEMAIVARRDRAIAGPHDLMGKKVGITFGTSGEYFLWAFLTRHKLPPRSVSLVNTPPGRMAGQLAAGAVDAVSTWQPVRLSAEVVLGSEAITFVEPDAYTVNHVVAGIHAWLSAHVAAVEAFLRAALLAEAFNRSHRPEALALLAPRMNTSEAALQTAWKELDLVVELQQSLLVTLEDEARWAMARGHVPGAEWPNFLPRLHLDPLLAVAPERVSVVH